MLCQGTEQQWLMEAWLSHRYPGTTVDALSQFKCLPAWLASDTLIHGGEVRVPEEKDNISLPVISEIEIQQPREKLGPEGIKGSQGLEWNVSEKVQVSWSVHWTRPGDRQPCLRALAAITWQPRLFCGGYVVTQVHIQAKKTQAFTGCGESKIYWDRQNCAYSGLQGSACY